MTSSTNKKAHKTSSTTNPFMFPSHSDPFINTNFDPTHQEMLIIDPTHSKSPKKRSTSSAKKSSPIIIQDSYWSSGIISKNDKVIYKGGMQNSIKHGYGKEFFTNGRLGFSGGFEYGKYCGDNCRLFYYTGGIYYKGQMARGKKEGYGILYNKSGT